MMPLMSLLETTRTLLQKLVDSDMSLRQIARESEGAVEYDWLKRFYSGDIKDPSVNRVQALHDCLAAKEPGATA